LGYGPRVDAATLLDAGPSAQREALRDGRVSAVALADASVAAARELDARVNAFVSIDGEGARAAAEDADRRRAAGEDGPLLGVPIAIKDDLDVTGRVTGWGSRARTAPATRDDTVITRVRAAGMVPIGTTTLPELAAYGVTDSALTGITRNPLAPDRTPGGSSGGSAAAVAGGAVGIATASDGAGSIRIPAACCGLSVQGCLTRRVRDAAVYLDVLGGFPTSLADAADRDPAPLRIGVDLRSPVTPALPLHPEVAAAVERTADLLAALGHRVAPVHVRYGATPLGLSARMVRSLHEAAVATDDPAELEARTRELARLGALVPGRLMGPARRHGRAAASRMLGGLGIDVLLTPVARGPAVPVGRWADRGGLATLIGMARHYPHTPAWNHTGQPAASLPAGETADGLPLAVQLVVGPGEDARLVSLAAQLERQGPRGSASKATSAVAAQTPPRLR
jgi:amidase